MKKEKKIKGYKAFNKDWTCLGFKYEVGKTYKINKKDLKMCQRGFHFCKNSCDVLQYYDDIDCKYAIVEAQNVTTKDNKSVCSEITIVKEITKNELLQAHQNKSKNISTTGNNAHSSTTGDLAHSSTTGNNAHSSTAGNNAHSSTTGYNAHSSTTGYNAHSSTTGNSAHSSTAGNNAHSSTTGDYAHSSTAGNSAHSSTTGYNAHSSTTGDYAYSSTAGYNCISISCGIRGKAKATKGFIFIADWRYTTRKQWYILNTYTAKIGKKIKGKTIKPDHWYWFEKGKLMEEKAEQ